MRDLREHRADALAIAMEDLHAAAASVGLVHDKIAELHQLVAAVYRSDEADLHRVYVDAVAAHAARVTELARAIPTSVAKATGLVISALPLAFEHARRVRAAAASDGQQILDRPAGSS